MDGEGPVPHGVALGGRPEREVEMAGTKAGSRDPNQIRHGGGSRAMVVADLASMPEERSRHLPVAPLPFQKLRMWEPESGPRGPCRPARPLPGLGRKDRVAAVRVGRPAAAGAVRRPEQPDPQRRPIPLWARLWARLWNRLRRPRAGSRTADMAA